jgi:aspartate/methionine/tyrosine aminotransferase
VENHRALSKAVEACPACSLLHAEGGWYAVVQVPATRAEEALVLDLLQNAEVLVHPGYFFDFQREAFIVVSLLPEPQLFVPAIARMLAEIARVS